MKPIVFGLVGALLLGFAVGHFTADTFAPGKLTPLFAGEDDIQRLKHENERLTKAYDEIYTRHRAMQREFTAISQFDMEDYLRLKDVEQKFQKVNEILGKLFLIFVNELLVDAPREQIDFAKQAAGKNKVKEPVARSAPSELPSVDAAVPAGGAASPKKPAETAQDWVEAEQQLGAMTPEKLDSFLAAAAIKDLRPELKGAKAFTAADPRVAHLQGLYTGDVVFLDPKEAAWHMELDTSGDVQSGEVKGSEHIRLYKEGNKFSDSNSEGSLKGIFNPASNSQAIIIKTGGENRFFQLYYIESLDMLAGNFYEMSPAGEFSLKARVKLSR